MLVQNKELQMKTVKGPPTAKPFSTPLFNAYRWSVLVCIRYLKEIIERDRLIKTEYVFPADNDYGKIIGT